MKAPEYLPLVMEPESRLYNDPGMNYYFFKNFFFEKTTRIFLLF